jgi:8-oxo-dGTP pyrophosphatase MutT (NUDIX family)
MKQIDKLALIEIKDKKYFPPKFWKDKYYIPGGKREVNETDLEALTRNKRRIKRRSWS